MEGQNTGTGSAGAAEAGSTQETVDFKSFDTAVKQKKQWQEKAQKAESELEELRTWRQEQQQLKESEDEKLLEEQNKHKEIADKYRVKLDEAENRNVLLQDTLIESAKVSALESALPAKLKNPAYRAHYDLGAIAIDEEGNIDKESVQATANKFLESHSSLLNIKSANSLPNDSAQSSSSGTYEQFRALIAAGKIKEANALGAELARKKQ